MMSDKKKVNWLLQAQNIVDNAIRKIKPSTAYNQTVTYSVLSIVKEGKLPHGINHEAFINQKIVTGGDWNRVPDLPKGLSYHVSIETLFDLVRRYHRCQDDRASQY